MHHHVTISFVHIILLDKLFFLGFSLVDKIDLFLALGTYFINKLSPLEGINQVFVHLLGNAYFLIRFSLDQGLDLAVLTNHLLVDR